MKKKTLLLMLTIAVSSLGPFVGKYVDNANSILLYAYMALALAAIFVILTLEER
ncbi:hypothetical protein [Aeromonas sp. Y318-3]|uniref:hypothetical protein n=1 Tax=Aeromonas sp. Y318-3 TaxID=2990509 RepID=UPI0022E2AB46|nr:hypothetical protein [Aeromonas sp. Y318-3]